jgi:hypothetical protein
VVKERSPSLSQPITLHFAPLAMMLMQVIQPYII